MRMNQRITGHYHLFFGVLSLLFAPNCLSCLGKDPSPAESNEQSLTELARVADQLDALGAQFDADQNQELSHKELEAMQKHVAEKFGRVWAAAQDLSP